MSINRVGILFAAVFLLLGGLEAKYTRIPQTDEPVTTLTPEQATVKQDGVSSSGQEVSIQDLMSAKCPVVDGWNPVYYRHPYDCSLFFQCNNGVAYQHHCPAGLHFDAGINTCNFPQFANCTIRRMAKSRPVVKTGPNVPSLEELMSHRCPEVDGVYPVYFPHPHDCSKFFQCSDGTAYQHDCPAGLHFDSSRNVCNHPENAQCSIAEALRKDISYLVVSRFPVHCPSYNYGYAVHLPNPVDCGSFYKCDWGTPVLFLCPTGLHFSVRIGVCDWPWRAGCTQLLN